MAPAMRWVRFNLVGAAGFVVQMLTLAAVTRCLDLPQSIAVVVAVLAAVSHNFVWHERVTWPGQQRQGRLRRWLSFNLSAGLMSIVTNVVVTALVVGVTGVPLLAANAMAVALASVVNFLLSDRYVFSQATDLAQSS
jgi:dolichol-phosphate mannosyltransferase